MKNTFLLVVISVIQINCFAQLDSTDVGRIYDDLFDDLETEESNLLLEQIEYFIDNPIDLNSCDISDLIELPFVDSKLANNIIQYRDINERYFSINEIFLIKDISNFTAQKIIPFLIVNPPEKKSLSIYDIFSESKIKIRNRIQEKLSNPDNGIAISPSILNNRIYNRFTVSNNSFSFGALIEKDPLERNINDYYSLFLDIKSSGLLRQLTIGDYSLAFGQGLVLWNPYGFSKGSDAFIPFKRKPKHIKANTSSNETAYFSGVGVNIRYKDVYLKTFYSYTSRDASLDESGNITSLSTTGYHRTESELSKKGNTQEQLLGLVTGFKNSYMDISFLGYNIHYNRNFISDKPFGIEGNTFRYYSISYSTYNTIFEFTGETAYNEISIATINSLQLNVTEKLKLLFSYRNYPADFSTLFGNAVGERTGNINERGYYTGIKLSFGFAKLDAYYDLFLFPQSSSYSHFPTSGSEYLVNIETRWVEKMKLRIKFKHEEKSLFNKEIAQTHLERKDQLKFTFSYKPVASLICKNGIDFTSVSEYQNSENGILLYQDIKYSYKSILGISARFILFDTDSYQSRIYHFENDVKGIMSNLPFYEAGNKFYLLVNFAPLNWLQISGKYSSLNKSQRSVPTNSNLYNWQIFEDYYSIQLDIKF